MQMQRLAAPSQATVLFTAWLSLSATAAAQGPWHYQDKADLPPGTIGQRQLERGGPRPGYFQPVEVAAPGGSLVSVVVNGGFSEAMPSKLLAGMLIGPVYRLKVANIPGHEGQEVFPTIEVVDRLYPPPGQATRFPIPIVLTQEELAFALDGRYVLRVIYLEDQKMALPVSLPKGEQQYNEIAPGQDAMEAADRLGRPVAILRMGSRVPMPNEDQTSFLYAQPPLVLFPPPPVIDRTKGLEEPLEAPPRMGRPSRDFLRVPVSQLR
jgi:hypothetical protein